MSNHSICSHPYCGRKRHTKLYCGTHHRQMVTKGVLTTIVTPRKGSERMCPRCDMVGVKRRGTNSWYCLMHYRFETMRDCSKASGKYVPSPEQLNMLATDLIYKGMKCEYCGVVMQWSGKHKDLHTVSLQHDRSGGIRFLCKFCNIRHDDLPGDTFYELPKGHWRCPRCKEIKPTESFYSGKKTTSCKECVSKENKILWAKHGAKWDASRKEKNRKKLEGI